MTEQFFSLRRQSGFLFISQQGSKPPHSFMRACKLFILLCIKTASQIFTPINQGQWQRSQRMNIKSHMWANLLHICAHATARKKQHAKILHISLTTTTSIFFFFWRGGRTNPIHVYAVSKNQLNTKEHKGIIWSAPSGR